jgi:hypothetical protein
MKGVIEKIRRLSTKSVTVIQAYFKSRHQLSRYCGLAFITEERRKRYFQEINERWKGDEERINKIVTRTIIGRNLRINFWRYLLLVCAIVFAIAHYNNQHPFAVLLYGVSFYIFVHLSFLYGLENDNKKLNIELFDLVGRKRKQREAQKPIAISANGETFNFFLQDILTIEYFLWLAKEETKTISFSPVNSSLIEEKIFKKWEIRKKAAFDKLITSSQKSSFAFLSYKTKANRKRNAVNNKLDSILNYFAINNYWEAKKKLEEFFGLNK